MAGDKAEAGPKKRKRSKGVPWKSGVLLNSDKPLGLAWEGRVDRVVGIGLTRSQTGGSQLTEQVYCFDFALELNARWLYAFDRAIDGGVLDRELTEALDQVTLGPQALYLHAIEHLTQFRSAHAHTLYSKEVIRTALRTRRPEAEIERLLRVRAVLIKGREDAHLIAKRENRFKRDNVDNDRRPSEAVLLRTIVPFALADRAIEEVEEIKTMLAKGTVLRERSDVTPEQMALMAFHAQVNPSNLYRDFDYLDDILDLAIYAGRYAVGWREPMERNEVKTYREMLCEGGVDPEPQKALRPDRAAFAQALRVAWMDVPGLRAATARYGGLMNA